MIGSIIQVAPSCSWGDQQAATRIFAGVRTALADPSLPALSAEVRATLPIITWAHIAELFRAAESKPWRKETVSNIGALQHQSLWLLLGGDAPSPRQMPDGYSKGLVAALKNQVKDPLEADAIALAQAARKHGAAYNLAGARVRVAEDLPWSLPADVDLLRSLMSTPKECSESLRAVFAGSRALPPSGSTPITPATAAAAGPGPSRAAAAAPTAPAASPAPAAAAAAAAATPSRSRFGTPHPITSEEHNDYRNMVKQRFTDLEVVAGDWQVKADAAVAMNITLTKKLVETQLRVRTVKDEASRKQAESRSAARRVKELHGKDRRAWRAETESLKSRHDADLRLAWQAEACQESERGKRQRDELARTRAQMGEAESARRAADQRAAAAEDASAEAQKDADEAAAERAAQFSAWADSTCSSPSGSTLWAARFGRRTANGAQR